MLLNTKSVKVVYDKNFEKERKNEDAFENESGVTKVKNYFVTSHLNYIKVSLLLGFNFQMMRML